MADEIFRLDIDIQAMLAKQAQLKKETDELKKSIKELDTTTKEGRETFVKQEATLKNLQGQYNANRTALSKMPDAVNNYKTATEAATKALDKQIDSIEDARENNKELLNIRNKVNANTEQGRKAIERINQKLNENNAFIKENVSNYEQQKIGIGDYEGAIKRALPGLSGLIDNTKSFVEGLIAQKAALTASVAGTTGATKAMKLFKIALASTGIGAIVIALGSLVAYLTQTQEGIDIVNRASAAISATWQVLVDRAIQIYEGFKLLIGGEVTQGVEKLRTSFKGLGAEIANEAREASNLEGRLQAIEKAEARLEVRRAQQKKDFAELKLFADDVNNSLEARVAAAEKGLGGEAKLIEEQVNLLKDKLEITKQQNALGTSTEADLQKERDLEIEIAALQEASFNKRTELNNKLNTLKQQAAAQEQAQIKKNEEAIQEQLNLSIEQMQRNLEEYRIMNKSKLEADQELSDQLIAEEESRMSTILEMKYAILEKQLEAEKMTEEQVRLEKLKLEAEYQEQLSAIKDEYRDQEADKLFEQLEKEKEENELRKEREAEEYETYLALQEERGVNEFQLQAERLEREKQLAIQQAKEKGASIQQVEQLYAVKSERLRTQQQLAQTQSIQNTIGEIGGTYKSFFGESKELSVALAAADAFVGAQKAYLSQMSLPTPDAPLRAGAAYGQALAFGLANVAKVAAVQFEDGGLLQGPSHKQGGIPLTIAGRGGYEAEGGEYIVNKRATAAFLPLLESINKQYKVPGSAGVGMFQNGGIITSQLPGLNGQASIDFKAMARANSQAFAEAVRNLPNPVVIVDEINRGQQRVAEVVDGATI